MNNTVVDEKPLEEPPLFIGDWVQLAQELNADSTVLNIGSRGVIIYHNSTIFEGQENEQVCEDGSRQCQHYPFSA